MPVEKELRKVRQKQVQRLNAVAKAVGIKAISDGAAKPLVQALVDNLQKKHLTEPQREEVEGATARYYESFESVQEITESQADGESDAERAASKQDQNEGEASDKGQRQEKAIQWEFQAAQLTYNSVQGDWTSKSTAVLNALFSRFLVWLRAALAPLKPVGISATMEESTRAEQRHVHIHAYFHLSAKFKRRGRNAMDVFMFDGIRPHVEPNKASGKSYIGAVRHGHFYVVVNKIGSLEEWTDFPPWDAYGVEGWWLDNLLKQGKLERKEYLKLAAKVVIGFQKRLTDVRAAERFERECAVAAHVAKESSLLEEKVRPIKRFPEVRRFVDQFAETKERRAMLLIVGATNLGKSMLASNVLQQVGEIVGVAGFLEITVEDNVHLALEDYDLRIHSGVLLDGVADALTLKHHREALQGRAKMAKGGQSGTNVYAYPFTFSRRAVVATMDLSADNLGALETDHWLSCPENVITLRLKEKAFLEPCPEEVPMPPLPLLGAPDPRVPTSRLRNPMTGSPEIKRPR